MIARIKKAILSEDDECSAGSFYFVTLWNGTQIEVTAEKILDMIWKESRWLAATNNNS